MSMYSKRGDCASFTDSIPPAQRLARLDDVPAIAELMRTSVLAIFPRCS